MQRRSFLARLAAALGLGPVALEEMEVQTPEPEKEYPPILSYPSKAVPGLDPGYDNHDLHLRAHHELAMSIHGRSTP